MFIVPFNNFDDVEIHICGCCDEDCCDKVYVFEDKLPDEPCCEECDVVSCDECDCSNCGNEPVSYSPSKVDEAVAYLLGYINHLQKELRDECYRHDRLQDWDISRTKDFEATKAKCAELEKKLEATEKELKLTRSFILEHDLIWELHNFLTKEL